MNCECRNWGNVDCRVPLLGNGHHQKCQHFIPNVGAFELIEQLVNGIHWWASQEDGVPDELWEAYKKAYFIAKGHFPKEVPQ